jgi:hypothetical protein
MTSPGNVARIVNIRIIPTVLLEHLKPRHDVGKLDVRRRNILGHCGLDVQVV